MTYPLVRDLAAEGFSVRLACGVLGFSTQAFYAWLTNRGQVTAANTTGDATPAQVFDVPSSPMWVALGRWSRSCRRSLVLRQHRRVSRDSGYPSDGYRGAGDAIKEHSLGRAHKWLVLTGGVLSA